MYDIVIVYVLRKLESGQIQALLNQSQISIGQKEDWANSKLYTVVSKKVV